MSSHELVEMLQGLDQLLLGAVALLDGLDLVGDLLGRNFGAKTDLNDRVFPVESGHQLVVASHPFTANL